MKRTSDSDLLHFATDVALIFSGQCSILLTLMTNPRYLSFSIIISFLMTLSITHSPEQNVSVLRCLPCCLFFPPSNLVCLFLILSVKSDCTADRPCLAGTCLRPGIFATLYSMSSLLKHQAHCINAPWQPRLASIDVCLAWHFSRFPNQTLSHIPTGLLHHRVELFVFVSLSFCQHLSSCSFYVDVNCNLVPS